jgi:streptogramin lyase
MRFLRAGRFALAFALALLSSSTSALGAPTIREFPLASFNHEPFGITAGPDGSVWFADRGSLGGIGRITPAGEVSEFSGLTTPAKSIVLGPDGNLWFTETSAGLIGKITPSGVFSQFLAPRGSGAEPAGITVGPDGNLWFTESANPGAIGRITTAGTITEYTTGLTANSKPLGITAGPDGSLWFTESTSPGAIGRITTSGAITQYTAGLSASGEPLWITAGPDASLWFTESANPDAIGRITTSGAITQFAIPTANAQPDGITAADDGNVYFTELSNPGKIGMITPSGSISELATPTSNSQPLQIAPGPDGNLWFTEQVNNGQIASMTLAPSVDAASASSVTETSALLKANVGPNSQPTSYRFEYGPSAGYGSQTSAASAGSGAAGVAVSAAIGNLTPATLYHFRVVASNATGTSYGPDRTFTTSASLLAGNVLAPLAAGPSPPVLGRTALARALSGHVSVRAPGSSIPVPLTAARDISIGSLIDTRNGVVALTVALDRRGHTQSATLWRGEFVIRQSPSGNGMTTFTLAGARLSCPRRRHHAARLAVAATAKSRTGVHSLWARDNHGRFSTRGENSVATVRGTYWETVDRCDATLTVVAKGAVSVRDIHRHRTVLLRAGHSYLARA